MFHFSIEANSRRLQLNSLPRFLPAQATPTSRISKLALIILTKSTITSETEIHIERENDHRKPFGYLIGHAPLVIKVPSGQY